MSRITVIFLSIFLCSGSFATNESCEKYLRAFNTYEQLEAGKIVEKQSVFPLTEWSPDSQFEGFVLSKEAPEKAEVRISLSSKNGAFEAFETFQTWSLDSQYRVSTWDARKFFADVRKAKSFTVELHSGAEVLCKETKEILSGY
jgi:hypothetical protein